MKTEILPPRIPPPVAFESLHRYEYFDFAGDICQKVAEFSYIFIRYPENLQGATLGLMVQKLKPETFRFERV